MTLLGFPSFVVIAPLPLRAATPSAESTRTRRRRSPADTSVLYLSALGCLQPYTQGRILGWTPNAHSVNVCLARCAAMIRGVPLAYASFVMPKKGVVGIQWPRRCKQSLPRASLATPLSPLSDLTGACQQTISRGNVRASGAHLACSRRWLHS